MPAGAHVDQGSITAYGGVASAYRASAWADTFNVGPETVIHAGEVVPSLVNTSVPQAREPHECPSTPGLRCLTWLTPQLPEVREIIADRTT